MGTNNLYNQEAKEKIKELAEDIDFTMMATNLNQKPVHMFPMSTKKVDTNGDIWFLSGRDSAHNAHIQKDKYVQLSYANPKGMEFMVVFGKASITTDLKILEDLYGKSDDMWFNGLEDPNLSALKIEPLEAQYWEPKHNTFVTLFKMGVGAITGDQPDISEYGELEL